MTSSRMTQLKTEVNLSDQKLFELESVPDSVIFDHSAALTILNLSHNFIETIPDSIFGLWNLRRVNLFDNKLKSIPDNISKLQKVGCRISVTRWLEYFLNIWLLRTIKINVKKSQFLLFTKKELLNRSTD